MSLGKPSHSNSETATIRMRRGFVEAANKFYQVDRVLEGIPRFVVSHSSRPVPAEGENVSDGRFGVSEQNRFDLLFVVADARQMRDRIQFCCVLNALDKIM